MSTIFFYCVSGIILSYIVSTIKCQETTCGHVPTPDNGYRFNEPTYKVGTFIEFRCNEGYERTGLPKLLCRNDGQWNPETAPTCTIRDCGEFGEVLNGETFQDNTFVERNKYGSVVEVTCYNGYVLHGNSEVKCQSNGQWEDKPTCLQTTCAPYPGLNDSRCIFKTRYSNFRLFMVCRNDDIVSGTKVGSRYSQCDNHEWNNLDMACICNCKIPEFPPNTIEVKNLDENRFLSHGQSLDYSCSGSVDTIKTISKDQSIVCKNGNLLMQSPHKENILLSLFNQALNDTAFCISEQENTTVINNNEQENTTVISNNEQENTTVINNNEQENTTVINNNEQENTTVISNNEQENTTVINNNEQENTTVINNNEQENTTVISNNEQENTTVISNNEQENTTVINNNEQENTNVNNNKDFENTNANKNNYQDNPSVDDNNDQDVEEVSDEKDDDSQNTGSVNFVDLALLILSYFVLFL